MIVKDAPATRQPARAERSSGVEVPFISLKEGGA
jgi:hypothetical protein